MIPKTKKSSTKAKAVPLFVLGTDSAIIEKKEGPWRAFKILAIANKDIKINQLLDLAAKKYNKGKKKLVLL